MKLNYMLLDVFTAERLKGNPLAVVLKADGLLGRPDAGDRRGVQSQRNRVHPEGGV
ncbi:MAG: PhzF family phenazine biosynthesis protein [Rubrivivax sp.]